MKSDHFIKYLAFLSIVSSWSPTFNFLLRRNSPWQQSKKSNLFTPKLSLSSSSSPDNENSGVDRGVVVDATACSGLSENELSVVMEAVQQACQGGLVSCGTANLKSTTVPCNPPSVIGTLGRVLLLQTNLDDDSIEIMQYSIAEQMDHLLYSENPPLKQPVLISMRNDIPLITDENFLDILGSIVEQEVQMYEMTIPLPKHKTTHTSDSSFIPSLNLKIDGAQTIDEFRSTTFWDTSSVLIFDGLLSSELRQVLLDVTLGREDTKDDKNWDDEKKGPNPERWIRGGLLDIPDEDEGKEVPPGEQPCWGLTDEAIEDLCFHHHDAIEEFEAILTDLFPQFIVTRLPEAVFGSCVSPLTANAPTFGDIFDFHIDGDPNLTPPSPFQDVFGRYPNRIAGKPRFMSCLLYLNDEWNEEEWGAPTKFLDIPTNTSYEVLPRPGRCILMDQDVSHTVVAPNEAAGKRPRYSLVWKLILHPKEPDQDMDNLAGGRVWPEPILFGSATP